MPLLETFANATKRGWLSSGASAGTGVGAYELISTLTGTGNPTSFTFSSIPQTYKHLQLRVVGRMTNNNAGTGATTLTMNGDTTSTYWSHFIKGSGTVASNGGSAAAAYINAESFADELAAANVFSSSIIDILDYTSTTKNKTTKMLVGSNVSTNLYVSMNSGLWTNTSAITSLTWKSVNTRIWDAGTRISLYGIKG